MHRINLDFDRVPPEILREYAEYTTPLISDVLDKNRQTMRADMKPVSRKLQVVGSALTVDSQPGDNLVLHRALSLAQENDVIVVNADGHSEAGIWGELMSIKALRKGVAGTVIEGAARDVTEIAELEYGVFSTHVSPKGSSKQLMGSINVPISCSGIQVFPGDLICGDANGVVVVPFEEVREVLDACRDKQAAETEVRQGTGADIDFTDRYGDELVHLEHEKFRRATSACREKD
jgi:4-hydroxy-4-methyl-2-oxoglutarate aldolase